MTYSSYFLEDFKNSYFPLLTDVTRRFTRQISVHLVTLYLCSLHIIAKCWIQRLRVYMRWRELTSVLYRAVLTFTKKSSEPWAGRLQLFSISRVPLTPPTHYLLPTTPPFIHSSLHDVSAEHTEGNEPTSEVVIWSISYQMNGTYFSQSDIISIIQNRKYSK